MSIQDFLDQCDDGVDIGQTFHILWSKQGIGWGQFQFYMGDDEKIHIDNECMDKRFIKEILCQMVDNAVLDDEVHPRPSKLDVISDEGC
jgi:hypothetical protein